MKRTRFIDGELSALYLSLCRHWIKMTAASGDPRFLNAALKISAVSILNEATPRNVAATAVRDGISALEQLAATSQAAPLQQVEDQGSHIIPGVRLSHQARIAVLAGEDSRGVRRFVARADEAGVPVTGILLYELTPEEFAGSSYSAAWYPAPRSNGGASGHVSDVAGSAPTERITHGDWGRIVNLLHAWRIDLVVLLGMEIIPPEVVMATSCGAINAHNGALPAYRGMDAVGWAVLAGTRPTCTVHQVTAEVDAGAILETWELGLNESDLRESVKEAQVAMLVDVCRTLVSSGCFPPARPQIGNSRRYYRMHPAIKRLLDSRIAALFEQANGGNL